MTFVDYVTCEEFYCMDFDALRKEIEEEDAK